MKLDPQIQSKKVVGILPPASPGSRGDQAILEGLLVWLKSRKIKDVIIFNPERSAAYWKRSLNVPAGMKVGEIRIDLNGSVEKFDVVDLLLIAGADVIDGGLGTAPAQQRMDLCNSLTQRGKEVEVICFSFQRESPSEVLRLFSENSLVRFTARDRLSQSNFVKSTGRQADYLPDFSLLAPAFKTNRTIFFSNVIRQARDEGKQIIALNFSYHGLYYGLKVNDRSDDRRSIVGVIDEILKVINAPYFVTVPHDTRIWPSVPNDEYYASIASEILEERRIPNCNLPVMSFGEVVDIADCFDICVSGRMHLALACLRANVPTLTFRSNEKLAGFYSDYYSCSWDKMSPNSIRGFEVALCDMIKNINSIRKNMTDGLNRAYQALAI